MTTIKERIYKALVVIQKEGYSPRFMEVHLGAAAAAQYRREFQPPGFSVWETERILGMPVLENPALGDNEVRLRYEVNA